MVAPVNEYHPEIEMITNPKKANGKFFFNKNGSNLS